MKKVYISFASDIIHSGHINILNRAAELGEVTAGVMTNEAVSAFDRYPITSLEERMKVLKNLKSVARVVVQDTVDGAETLRASGRTSWSMGTTGSGGPWRRSGKEPWAFSPNGAGSWWSSPTPTTRA